MCSFAGCRCGSRCSGARMGAWRFAPQYRLTPKAQARTLSNGLANSKHFHNHHSTGCTFQGDLLRLSAFGGLLSTRPLEQSRPSTRHGDREGEAEQSSTRPSNHTTCLHVQDEGPPDIDASMKPLLQLPGVTAYMVINEAGVCSRFVIAAGGHAMLEGDQNPPSRPRCWCPHRLHHVLDCFLCQASPSSGPRKDSRRRRSQQPAPFLQRSHTTLPCWASCPASANRHAMNYGPVTCVCRALPCALPLHAATCSRRHPRRGQRPRPWTTCACALTRTKSSSRRGTAARWW